MNEFAISYFSKGFVKNLNCKSEKPLIECRHLAYWWINQKKPEYDKINTLEKLQNCQGIPSDKVHRREVLCNGCASEAIYFDLQRFPEALQEMASRLKEGKKKRWYLESTTHVMGLSIRHCRDNRIVIKYYDPNDTLRHKRIVVETQDKLTTLTPGAFWDNEDQNWYFPEKNKVGCLSSIDRKAHRDECHVKCIADHSDVLMYHLLNQGHYGHRAAVNYDQQIDLSAKRFDDLQGFFMALYLGHSEAVKNYMQKVLARGDLSAEQKAELLTAIIDGMPGLLMALYLGHSAAVKTFVKEVLASGLPDEIKEQLLAAKRKNGTQGLLMALQNGHSKTVEIFLKEVLASSLPDKIKERLLAAKRANGTSGLSQALKHGHSKTVEIFLRVVLESRYLSDEQKAEILIKAVRTNDNTGGLTLALKNGHSKTVKIFLEEVLESLYLSHSSKKYLLINAVRGSDGIGGLSSVLSSNDDSTALKVFREKVSASQLSEETKKLLVPLIP